MKALEDALLGARTSALACLDNFLDAFVLVSRSTNGGMVSPAELAPVAQTLTAAMEDFDAAWTDEVSATFIRHSTFSQNGNTSACAHCRMLCSYVEGGLTLIRKSQNCGPLYNQLGRLYFDANELQAQINIEWRSAAQSFAPADRNETVVTRDVCREIRDIATETLSISDAVRLTILLQSPADRFQLSTCANRIRKLREQWRELWTSEVRSWYVKNNPISNVAGFTTDTEAAVVKIAGDALVAINLERILGFEFARDYLKPSSIAVADADLWREWKSADGAHGTQSTGREGSEPIDEAPEWLGDADAEILQALVSAGSLRGEALAKAACGKNVADGKFKTDCSNLVKRQLITAGVGRNSVGYSITPKGRALLKLHLTNRQDHSQ
jgi:hypothetical protein